MKTHLDDQIKELKESIETDETPLETPEEPAIVEEAAEPVTEEIPAEEPIKEPVKEEPKPDSMAQLAYELREERRLRKEAEAKSTPAPVKEEPKNQDPMPNPEEDPLAYLAWENRQVKRELEEVKGWKKQSEQERQQQDAERQRISAFQADSSSFASQTPDYEQVIDHMFNQIKSAAKMTSPNATPQQIEEFARNRMLTWGSEYGKQGYNQGQALYLLSKQQYGYQPPVEQATEQPAKIQRAPLALVEKNKQKSAHGIGTGTTKANVITPEAYAKMSISDIEQNKDELISAGFIRR